MVVLIAIFAVLLALIGLLTWSLLEDGSERDEAARRAFEEWDQ